MYEAVFDQHHWLYIETELESDKLYELDDFAQGHLRSLRVSSGEEIVLADGKGRYSKALVQENSKKSTLARTQEVKHIERPSISLKLYIAFTKNNNRNEWLVEKATELGVDSIVPIISYNSEKVFLKRKRLDHILISAMIQSRRLYLPILEEEQKIEDLSENSNQSLVLAHCYESDSKISILDFKPPARKEVCLLIGPEGDFTREEVEYLCSMSAVEVSLGSHRLRTETAAIQGLGVLSLKLDKSL